MGLSTRKYKEIARFFIAEWTRRSESELAELKGKGCFVWDSDKDSQGNGSGEFYMGEMLSLYFPPETAKGLQEMIAEADHDSEVVVCLVFGDEAVGLRLRKSTGKDAIETVPPIVH
ncbi:MAG: hypothetical protein AB2L11_05585 [Syntrophobacteraceae bacterium]